MDTPIKKKLDIKLLILLVLSRFKTALDKETLQSICVDSIGVAYLFYIDCIYELIDSELIKDLGDKFEITVKGRRNSDEVSSSLPFSVRTDVERLTKPIIDKLARDSMIITEHSNSFSGQNVHLSLSDGIGKIIDINIASSDEITTTEIENNFRNNAELIYNEIIELLLKKGR